MLVEGLRTEIPDVTPYYDRMRLNRISEADIAKSEFPNVGLSPAGLMRLVRDSAS